MTEDAIYKALADPTRREILKLVSKAAKGVGALVGEFKLSQPAISRHLAVLREAGLVKATRKGQAVEYSLETTPVFEVIRALTTLLGHRRERV